MSVRPAASAARRLAAAPLARATAAAGLLLGWAPFTACGPPSSSAPAAAAPRPSEPTFRDALEPPPAFMVFIRPRALRRDPVYGPLLQRVVQLAREESALVRAAASARALDAIEDADEVILAVDLPGARGRSGARGDALDADLRAAADLTLVVRGVRADVDPATLVDDQGMPLWAAGPGGPVRELALAGADGGPGPAGSDSRASDSTRSGPEESRPEASGAASLFELPGRTWVVATGAARVRARSAFARRASGLSSPAPASRLDPDIGDEWVVAATLAGSALVSHVRALRPPALLSPIGRGLETATVWLSPGSDALLEATLSYRDDDAVSPAVATVRDAISALFTAKPNEYAWLHAATVRSSGRRIVVSGPLPREIVAALLLPGFAPSSSAHTPAAGPATEPPASP